MGESNVVVDTQTQVPQIRMVTSPRIGGLTWGNTCCLVTRRVTRRQCSGWSARCGGYFVDPAGFVVREG